MTEWKSIDGAPLDTCIVAGGLLRDGEHVGWASFVVKKIRAYENNDKAFYYYGWSFHSCGKPTHYIDIPPPPDLVEFDYEDM